MSCGKTLGIDYTVLVLPSRAISGLEWHFIPQQSLSKYMNTCMNILKSPIKSSLFFIALKPMEPIDLNVIKWKEFLRQ